MTVLSIHQNDDTRSHDKGKGKIVDDGNGQFEDDEPMPSENESRLGHNSATPCTERSMDAEFNGREGEVDLSSITSDDDTATAANCDTSKTIEGPGALTTQLSSPPENSFPANYTVCPDKLAILGGSR